MSYGKDSDLICRFWIWGQSFRIKYPFQSHFPSLPQPCSWPPQHLEDGEIEPAKTARKAQGRQNSIRAGAVGGEALGSDKKKSYYRNFHF